MHGYGANTFSLVNKAGEVNYVKFHYNTNQGARNLDSTTASEISGKDPDYFIRDLYNHISEGDYPSWSFYIQIMTPQQAGNYQFDPFDVTKVWYHGDFPLIPVGKFTLNRNQGNYFAEVEQIAFNPSHVIPGISFSPDRMLQGRLFSYSDTHRHRLGTNYQQLPVNAPFRARTYTRDGGQTIDNQDGAPNYHPNSYKGPVNDSRAKALTPSVPVMGNSGRYDNGNDDNYTQPRALYQRVLDDGGRNRMASNIADSVLDGSESIRQRVIAMFSKVDEDFGRRIAQALQRLDHTARPKAEL